MSTSPFISATPYGTFIFFGCITTIAVFYVWLLVPETKGRTLEEMDEVFGSLGMAVEDEKRKLRIERELGLYSLIGAEPEAPAQGSEKRGDTEHADNAGNGKEHV